MLILCFYVPTKDKERVKEALFLRGAGKMGNYDQCCFEISGKGQFRALEGANPTLGKVLELETVEETKIEMVFPEELLKEIIETLKKSHPYEVVAFHILKSIEI